MLIHIQRKPLLATLAAFKTVVPAKSSMPVLHTVCIQASGDTATIDGTDLDTFVTVTLDAAAHKMGAVCVNRAQLHAAVKGMTADIVVIETNGPRLTVTGGGTVKLDTMDAAEYPKVPARTVGPSYIVSREMARNITRVVRPAVSCDETRYVLNGIYFHNSIAVATDGHRLHMCNTDIPMDATAAIVSGRAWDAFTAFLPDGGHMTFEGKDGKVGFSRGGIVITTRPIDGRFPDYTQVLPTRSKDESQAVLDVKGALPVVRTHAALTERKKSIAMTRFHMNGALSLSTDNPDRGTAEHTLTVERRGADVTWGANAFYVLDALRCFDGDVTLYALATMEKNGNGQETQKPRAYSLNPFELTDNKGTRVVVMPCNM